MYFSSVGQEDAGGAVVQNDSHRVVVGLGEELAWRLAPKLLQLEGGCHRRVVGNDILLPLDRILPYEGKSVYKIYVADELR